MDTEIASYIATACGVSFVAASGLAVLSMLMLNRAEREFKRLFGEPRTQELRLQSEDRTQYAQQHADSGTP